MQFIVYFFAYKAKCWYILYRRQKTERWKWSEVYSPLGQRDATYVFVALVFKL